MTEGTQLVSNLEYVQEIVQPQRGTDDSPPLQPHDDAEAAAGLTKLLSRHSLAQLIERDLAARLRHSRIALTWCLVAVAALAVLRIGAPFLPKPVTTYGASPLDGAITQSTLVAGALAVGLLGATLSLLIAPRLVDAKVERIDYRWGTYPRIVGGAALALLVGLVFFKDALVGFIYGSSSDMAAEVTAIGTILGAGFVTRYVLGMLSPLIKLPFS